MTEENIVIGVCWYKKAQWARLRDIVPDRNDLDDTYQQWRKDAEKALSELRANGHMIQKVLVDTEEMLAWANENNRELDSSARSEYAVIILQQRSDKK